MQTLGCRGCWRFPGALRIGTGNLWVKVGGWPCAFLDVGGVGVEADTIERQGRGAGEQGEGFWAASDREQLQGL